MELRNLVDMVLIGVAGPRTQRQAAAGRSVLEGTDISRIVISITFGSAPRGGAGVPVQSYAKGLLDPAIPTSTGYHHN
eukprot:SAG31_NODE_4242_length_3425_cov_1.926639_3_plen_78_part_00